MITLKRLTEKNENIVEKNNTISMCIDINFTILMLVGIIACFINPLFYLFGFLMVSWLILNVIYLINKKRSKNIKEKIVNNVERILESNLVDLSDDYGLPFVYCTQHCDNLIYACIEIYDSHITYDELFNAVEPISDEINEIIDDTLFIYYRVEQIENK